MSTGLAKGQGSPATARAAFLAAAAGRIDVPEAGVPASLLATARTRYPAQVYATPQASTNWVILNTHRPPFSNVHARRALAFALDRAQMVANEGGSDLAAPTCQLLPPGMPGYKPYCPFTAGSQTEEWTAPDLSRAKEEVTRSGTRGARVAVITTDQAQNFGKQNLVVAAALREPGYRVSVEHYATDNAYFSRVYNDPGHIDAAVNGWSQDYPAPANFFSALQCPNGPYCHPALDPRGRARGRRRRRDRRKRTVDATGSPGHLGGVLRALRQPEGRRLRREARRELPAPSRVRPADRPALGALSTAARRAAWDSPHLRSATCRPSRASRMRPAP